MFSLTLDRIARGFSGDQLGQELTPSLTAFSSSMVERADRAGSHYAFTYVVEKNKSVEVGDIADTIPSNSSRFNKAESFDGVFVYVEEAGGSRQIRIGRTNRTTTPLYLAATRDRIYASWDFWWVVDRLPNVIPDLDMCRRYIIEGPCLYNETLVDGVSLLLGGQTAIITEKVLTLTDPIAGDRFEPSALRPTADAALAFLDLIADSMRDIDTQNACIEVSGGYDSSCIAGACHRAGINVPYSYGIIQSGMAGSQQTLRRAELVKMIGVTDFELESSICTPLTGLVKNLDARVVPYDELYRAATTRCVNTLPNIPDVVISGLGGDELTIEEVIVDVDDLGSGYDEPLVRAANLLLGEIPAPKRELNVGPMGSSALGSICRADLFMTLGVWPKNPLTEPNIVRFAQLLPSSLKRDRTLNMLALAKIGLSDFFILRRYKENFRVAFENDLRAFDVDTFFRNGYIHEFGLASIAILSKQHERFINTGRCDLPLMLFANIALLERCLWRMYNRIAVL